MYTPQLGMSPGVVGAHPMHLCPRCHVLLSERTSTCLFPVLIVAAVRCMSMLTEHVACGVFSCALPPEDAAGGVRADPV
jgi:hypothetical protein